MLSIQESPNEVAFLFHHFSLCYQLPPLMHLTMNQAKPIDQKGSLVCQADLLLLLPLGKH